MARLGKSRSRRQWIVITVIVIAIAVIVIWWVAAARQVTGMATDLPADLPTTADRSIVASTDLEYPTLDALTASSDFVVKGSVVGVTQGGTWTFADDSGVPASGRLRSTRFDVRGSSTAAWSAWEWKERWSISGTRPWPRCGQAALYPTSLCSGPFSIPSMQDGRA